MNLSLMSFSFQTERLFHQMNAEKLCQIAKDNGVETVDLMVSEARLYGMKNLKKAFRQTGVTCGCIIAALPFFKGVEHFPAKLSAAFDVCEEIGTKNLMIVPGSGDGAACRELRREEMLRRTEELFTIAVNRAQERGIEVLFEDTPQNHKPLSSVADCRRILDKVPGLGFVFDTANFLVAEPEIDLLAAYEALKDKVRRVHLKDVVCGHFPTGEGCENGESIRCVATGSGILPLRPFIEKLTAESYDGIVCIEYAARSGIHGMDHGKYLDTYVRNIRAYEAGKIVAPPYREIPGVEKPVSRIFFGTAITSMLMGRNAEAILDTAMALGINAFDCARGYGMAEKSLGNWIKARNNRERVVLLTKCGNMDAKGNVHIDRAVIHTELARSLAALQTDYIDIYLLHRDDPKTPISEIVRTLNEIKAAGKIRTFGVSNWTHERIAEANAYAEENGLEGFRVSSPNFGLARQICDPWGGGCITVSGPENAGTVEWYAESGMPVIAYSSLGRGFFSGKFKSFDYVGAKKILDGPSQKGYLCEENMRRLRNAEALAEKYGTAVSDIAMRYVFGSRMNVFAVVSTTNPMRLADNVRSAGEPLGGEDIMFLESDTV